MSTKSFVHEIAFPPLPESVNFSGTKKRGLCKNVRFSWLWRSERHMHCWAQYPWVLFVSLGATLDSAKPPFAKSPFWGLSILRIFLLILLYSFLSFWAFFSGEEGKGEGGRKKGREGGRKKGREGGRKKGRKGGG